MRHLTDFYLGFAVLFIIAVGQTLGDSQGHHAKVADSAEDICPVLVGSAVPDVPLTTVEGEAFDLRAALTQKPTLLIFYRGGWCPFCNMHLAELQKVRADLVDMGYQILAVSMDRPAKLRESLQEHQLDYTLLSDSAAAAATAFGLAFRATSSNTQRLEAFSGEDHHILPVPAAFIVGTDGVIKFEYINPNYKVRVKSEIILAAARAELQK